MAYYNELFVEENDGILKHIGSSDGSDTPSYFDKIKNINDWNWAIKELKTNNNYWEHKNTGHPFPWDTYKTSDHLIVLRKKNKKWFEFWKPSHEVFISEDKYTVKDPNKSTFVNINKCSVLGGTPEDLIILNLPILKKYNAS